MKRVLSAIFCVAALPCAAQVPGAWSNISPAFQGSAVSGPNQDLGTVDGDKPVLTRMTVQNTGTTPLGLLVPSGISASPIRVQFPSALKVVIPPGGSVDLPVELDVRLIDGAGVVEVALPTDDAATPVVQQAFSLTAQHHARVTPYRDMVTRTGGAVSFSFEGMGGGKFVSAAVEDSAAPIAVKFHADESGRLVGTAAVDEGRATDAPKQGSVRVVGTTDQGATAYFWLQWLL